MAANPTPTPSTTPAPTWDDLAAAHGRAQQRAGERDGLPPHRPQVAVLTCADARVSPARLFDLPEGALFVVRVAGASATPEAVASLRYAVGELGVGTVVVLGHSHCGAVTAALADGDDPSIEALVAPIRPVVGPECDHLECAVPAHVAATVTALEHDPGPLGDALRSGRAVVHGAVVDLADGSLTRLPD